MKQVVPRIFLSIVGSLFLFSLVAADARIADAGVADVHVADARIADARVAEQGANQAGQAQPNKQVQEFDSVAFFGPEDLQPGEAIRSASMSAPAWQIYLESWGVWLAVRFDDAYAYVKSVAATVRDQVRRRITALIGLVYASRVEKEPKPANT